MSSKRKQVHRKDNEGDDVEAKFVGLVITFDDGKETRLATSEYPCLAVDAKRKHMAQGKPTGQAQIVMDVMQYYQATKRCSVQS